MLDLPVFGFDVMQRFPLKTILWSLKNVRQSIFPRNFRCSCVHQFDTRHIHYPRILTPRSTGLVIRKMWKSLILFIQKLHYINLVSCWHTTRWSSSDGPIEKEANFICPVFVVAVINIMGQSIHIAGLQPLLKSTLLIWRQEQGQE